MNGPTGMKVVHDPTVRWVCDSWVRAGADHDAGTLVGVLGIPFDHAVSHRPGARFGPAAILAALQGYSMYCTDKRVALDDTLFLDLGMVDVVHSFAETYRRVAEAVRSIPARVHPVLLGGDHSVTDPIFRGLLRRSPGSRFGFICFDAHFDSREPITGKEHSGNWMRTLEDVIDYGVVVQLGISAPIYSEHYMHAAESAGVMVRTPYDIRRRGWPRVIEEAVAHAGRGTDGVYISIDIDCLDQSFAPGTSVPNACGLFAHELVDAVFEISRQADVVGMDITEVSPPLDTQDYTAQVAAHLVLNHVAGLVSRAAAGPAVGAGAGRVAGAG
jgi:agmatinase